MRSSPSRPAVALRSRRRARQLLALLLLAASPARADDLARRFEDPPARLRPFVRWWWNGARVAEAEALRQLDVMKAAGIGGVEINSIAMPEYVPLDTLAAFPARPWLSPEWCRAVEAATSGARERGMAADLIVGSGWPFGGRFLQPAERTKRVRLVKREIDGPTVFEATVEELARAGARERGELDVPSRVLSVRLAPAAAAAAEFVPGEELLPRAVRGGRLGEGLGGPLRAVFIDSLELDHANWTDDLPAEFQRRRGYDLWPYLSRVLDPAESAETAGERPRAETVRRARYDFHLTLVELFHERFLQTAVAWAHEHGLQARVQAYGRETHPLEGGLLPDLPEGETWLWSGHDRVVVRPTVVNKYVSSAAHLAGRTHVSFEAMTSSVPVFRETLEDFKLGMDGSVLAGVLHPVIHGFNYSPPQAGLPGWVRFGSWLNEQNPWWPHFRRFADYAARLTTVLSGSEFQARIALLGPQADEWARDGLLYQPFPEVRRPWYHDHLWQALQSSGFGSDFVSEGVVRGSRAENGRLLYGTRSYDLLLLMDVESLEPETAEAVARFARGGGRVLFLGRRPERAPGLKDAAAADRRVREAAAAALAAGAVELPAPEPGGPLRGDHTRGPLPDHARRELIHWTSRWAHRFGIDPEVRIEAPHPDLGFVHHRAGERDIFFFANTSRREAIDLVTHFRTSSRPWLWDAETGARQPMPTGAAAATLALHFEPLQSMLVVYEPGPAPGPARSPLRPGRDPLPILGPWEVEFRPPAGPSFRRLVPQLFDLSLAAGDPAVGGFGGVAVYRTEFDWRDARLSLLSLGTVEGISSVRLNGRPLGVRWYGRHLYDTTGALLQGRNVVEVEVTTSLGNFMRSRRSDPATERWAFWFPPIPAGLVGPVQLMTPNE